MSDPSPRQLTHEQCNEQLQRSRHNWPRLREASTQFGISKYTLRRILKNGEVMGIQRGLGRHRHVDPVSLEQWLAQRREGPTP